VRWCRGKAEERVEDYLIKNLISSTNRQFYLGQIEAFRLRDEATQEVPLDVPQVAQPDTSRRKRPRNVDQQMLREAKRFLSLRWVNFIVTISNIEQLWKTIKHLGFRDLQIRSLNQENCENEVPTSRLCNLLKKLTIRESTPRINEMVINLKHYKYLLYFTLQNFIKRFSLRLQALLQRWIVTIPHP
jgi:hypothetical protein